MKLVSFLIDGRPGYGAVKGDGIVDLGRRLPAKSLRALLEADALGDAAALLASEKTDYAMRSVMPPSFLTPARSSVSA